MFKNQAQTSLPQNISSIALCSAVSKVDSKPSGSKSLPSGQSIAEGHLRIVNLEMVEAS